jgi:ParB family chromosome partitioning protein
MSTATVTQYEVGSTYHLPPRMLLLERNIREAKPDQGLIDSVAALGVLEPIGAVVTADGALLVRSGHRRTLAAIQTKTDTVPVYVRGTDDLDPGAEALRVIQQYDENTHRNGLTTAENVGVVDQLVMFGIPAEETSKRHRISKDQVDAAVRVSASPMATKAAAKWETLSLDEAAAIAEFEDDKDAVQSLVQAAHDGRFEHTVQRMRDDRDKLIKHAACIELIRGLGIGDVRNERPSHTTPTVYEDRLVDVATGKKIPPSKHRKCPGRIAWPTWNYNAKEYKPEYGCKDPAKYGHRDEYSSGKASRPALADLSEEQREAAKADRKLVIENNKAWASAETVRRSFLKTFANSKGIPKGAAALIATGITKDVGQFNYAQGSGALLADWLGTDDLQDLIEKAPEPRALAIALVRILAVYETNLSIRSWREDGTNNAAGRYLRFLQSVGYQLSDVELYAISKDHV